MASSLATNLRASLARQEELLRRSLVLNPVENFPFAEDLLPVAGSLHGLYNSDKTRSREQRLESVIQFAGRRSIESDSQAIYAAWAHALGAEDATLRLLSGLHAHIVLFMSVAKPGQTVLLLPVEGGGHLSGKAIVERLGLDVVEMAIDRAAMGVDVAETVRRCEAANPDFVFVDRSEGLVYEDFGWLGGITGPTKIFDASQYVSNIICGDHPNPFEWGFDLMVASVHKNFPGPQKALLATRSKNAEWDQVLRNISTFVSNMHSASTYAAGLTLTRGEWLRRYSRSMLRLAIRLEDELAGKGVPVVKRPTGKPPTHHVWIVEPDRSTAFRTYEQLEACRVMTNFRELPYGLGSGIRIGLSAAARLGLEEKDMPQLAELIAEIRRQGATPPLKAKARAFNEMAWSRP